MHKQHYNTHTRNVCALSLSYLCFYLLYEVLVYGGLCETRCIRNEVTIQRAGEDVQRERGREREREREREKLNVGVVLSIYI